MAMEEVISKAEAAELRDRMSALKSDVSDVVRHAKDRVVSGTSAWAKEHPGMSIGMVVAIAAGIGLTIGLLIGRGRD